LGACQLGAGLSPNPTRKAGPVERNGTSRKIAHRKGGEGKKKMLDFNPARKKKDLLYDWFDQKRKGNRRPQGEKRPEFATRRGPLREKRGGEANISV